MFFKTGVPQEIVSSENSALLHEDIPFSNIVQADPLFPNNRKSNTIFLTFYEKVVLATLTFKGAELYCQADPDRSEEAVRTSVTFYTHSCASKNDNNPNSVCKISKEITVGFYHALLTPSSQALWIGLSLGALITVVVAIILFSQYRKLNSKYERVREELQIKHLKYLQSDNHSSPDKDKINHSPEKYNDFDSELPSRIHNDLDSKSSPEMKENKKSPFYSNKYDEIGSDGSQIHSYNDDKIPKIIDRPKSRFLRERESKDTDSPVSELSTNQLKPDNSHDEEETTPRKEN
jgi:hypothetical protein